MHNITNVVFPLTLSTLGKNFSRRHTEIFFLFFWQLTGFVISCKLSPMEPICMKCQILFSAKNKKNNVNLSSAEYTCRVVNVKTDRNIPPKKNTCHNITKTRLYNFYPLKPHFYIVKLGFTGVYIIFLISAQKHRLWVFVRTASQSNPQSMFGAEQWKIFEFFLWKFSIFRWFTFQYIWIGMFS